MNTKIGRYLRNVRTSKGNKGIWSIRSVAKRSGISDSYLSQLETGQVKQPLPEVLKRLSETLGIPYQDLLCAAGYITPERSKPQTIEIPVIKEISQKRMKSFCKKIADNIVVDYNFVGDKNCFAVRIKGDFLKNCGIANNDVAIISRSDSPSNGNIIIATIGGECVIRKFYKIKGDKKSAAFALQSCDESQTLEIYPKKTKSVEITGKIIRVLKAL